MKNTSGREPLDMRVLILPDPVEEKHGSIFLPEAVKEQERYAQMTGTLVALGENAWEEAAARSPNFKRPQPGDRVMIAKYGGILFKGDDGAEYRIMNDEDVTARVVEG